MRVAPWASLGTQEGFFNIIEPFWEPLGYAL
jgi:hypothetical protein